MQTPGTRSRQGCLPCRRRHRKCDEGKPTCHLCHKTGRTCEYESGFRWASVSQPSPGGSDHTAKKAKVRRARCRPQQESDQNTVSLNEPANVTDRAVLATKNPPFPETFVGNLSSDGLLGDYSTLDTGPSPDGGDTMWTDLLSEKQFTDLLGSSHDGEGLLEIEESDARAPLIPCYDLSLSNSHRSTAGTLVAPLNASSADRTPQPGPAQQDISDAGVRLINPGLGPWLPPTLVSSSEELTLSYYISDASPRMPAFDGPKNPYRRLSLVAISYPLILHTILYISSVSMKNYGKGDEGAITHRRTQALVLLHRAGALLESQKAAGGTGWMEHDQTFSVLSLREVTLAAHLMHIVADVMAGSHTTEAYLQDAYRLMIELGYIDHLPQGFYPRFLTQRFAMIDVVLSFLRHRKPFAPKHFVLYHQPMDEVDQQEPCFRELTGCPQAVLSFLARISILATQTRGDGCSHLAEAYQLESEMRLWGALRYPGPLSGNADPLPAITGESHGSAHAHARGIGEMQLDTLSECFYWTAHLLLVRRVFLDPTASGRVQMYRRHLFDLMDRLPAGCGPDSSLPFPFYMAAREAMSSQDREWVRQKHADMLSQYRERAREVMMSLTEEIWRKNDGDMSAMGAQQSLSPSIWVNDDIYISVLDSQASHFVF